ncbi:hypothetical protein PSHT_03731, partial [Puccinia striiformis]
MESRHRLDSDLQPELTELSPSETEDGDIGSGKQTPAPRNTNTANCARAVHIPASHQPTTASSPVLSNTGPEKCSSPASSNVEPEKRASPASSNTGAEKRTLSGALTACHQTSTGPDQNAATPALSKTGTPEHTATMPDPGRHTPTRSLGFVSHHKSPVFLYLRTNLHQPQTKNSVKPHSNAGFVPMDLDVAEVPVDTDVVESPVEDINIAKSPVEDIDVVKSPVENIDVVKSPVEDAAKELKPHLTKTAEEPKPHSTEDLFQCLADDIEQAKVEAQNASANRSQTISDHQLNTPSSPQCSSGNLNSCQLSANIFDWSSSPWNQNIKPLKPISLAQILPTNQPGNGKTDSMKFLKAAQSNTLAFPIVKVEDVRYTHSTDLPSCAQPAAVNANQPTNNSLPSSSPQHQNLKEDHCTHPRDSLPLTHLAAWCRSIGLEVRLNPQPRQAGQATQGSCQLTQDAIKSFLPLESNVEPLNPISLAQILPTNQSGNRKKDSLKAADSNILDWPSRPPSPQHVKLEDDHNCTPHSLTSSQTWNFQQLPPLTSPPPQNVNVKDNGCTSPTNTPSLLPQLVTALEILTAANSNPPCQEAYHTQIYQQSGMTTPLQRPQKIQYGEG